MNINLPISGEDLLSHSFYPLSTTGQSLEINIYREIKDPITETAVLQSDLYSLSGWAATWQMTFNADKCESIRITHFRDNTSPNCTLGENSLKTVQSV